MSNNMKMSGATGSTWCDPGERSNDSDGNVATITRTGARTRAWTAQDKHQRARRSGAAELAGQVSDWLAGLSGDDAAEASALLDSGADLWAAHLREQEELALLAAYLLTQEAVAQAAAEVGTPLEGLALELSLLGTATELDFAEAWGTYGFLVTRAPYGYTRGLS